MLEGLRLASNAADAAYGGGHRPFRFCEVPANARAYSSEGVEEAVAPGTQIFTICKENVYIEDIEYQHHGVYLGVVDPAMLRRSGGHLHQALPLELLEQPLVAQLNREGRVALITLRDFSRGRPVSAFSQG